MGRPATAQKGATPADQGAESLLNDYLRMLLAERNRSAYTLRNYASGLRASFACPAEEAKVDVLAADRHTVRAYIASLMESGVAPASIGRKISTLRSFYRYLRQEGRVESNPCDGVHGPKRPRRLPNFLTEEEVIALVSAPDPDKPQGLRNRALLEPLYAAGVRVGEGFNLNTPHLEPW